MAGTIQLQNPEQQNFEPFIAGNSLQWQCLALARLEDTLPADAYKAIYDDFMRCKAGFAFSASPIVHDALATSGKHDVIQEGEAKGHHLVLCGAGPSLAEHARDYCPSADQV